MHLISATAVEQAVDEAIEAFTNEGEPVTREQLASVINYTIVRSINSGLIMSNIQIELIP